MISMNSDSISDIIGVSTLPTQVMEDRIFHAEENVQEDREMDFKLREMIHMKELLEQYGDTTEGKKQVARQMGISLATLYRRINKMHWQNSHYEKNSHNANFSCEGFEKNAKKVSKYLKKPLFLFGMIVAIYMFKG